MDSFSLEPLAPARVKELYRQATEYVDSRDVPQANTLSTVFRFVDVTAEGTTPSPENLEVGKRQVNYYRRASEILGYLSSGVLTPAGRQIAALESKRDRLRSAVVHFESSRVGSAWLRWAEVDSLSDLDPTSADDFLQQRAVGLTGDTIGRRAATLRRWWEELVPHHYRSRAA